MPLAVPRRFLLRVLGVLLAVGAVLTATPASAHGTSTGGAYLPVLTSPDLRTWTARPAYDPGRPLNRDPYFNDALPYPATWGADRSTSDRMTKEVWAPGVAPIGSMFGVPGRVPTRIWSRQLNTAGTGFAPGSTNHALLATALSREGNLIENPSMIRWGGALWLFYAANEWRSGNYATGYAKCSTPVGPCKRAS